MCSIIDSIGKCFKTVLVCACFLLIGGLILIAVGAVFLKEPNLRAQYNDAIKDFNSTPVKSWKGNINNVPTTIGHESLDVESVDTAVSLFAHALLPSKGLECNGTYNISVDIKNVRPFKRQVPLCELKRESFKCSTKSSDCSGDMHRFEQDCTSSGGKYNAKSCIEKNYLCGSCTHVMHLSGVYLVLHETSPGQFAEDPTLKSALYDFGDSANIYATYGLSTVAVRLYSNTDPRIALERHTKGTKDFGPDRRSSAIAMIVCGSILLFLAIVLCFLLLYFMCRRKKSFNAPDLEAEEESSRWPNSASVYGNSLCKSYGGPHQNQPPGALYAQPFADEGCGKSPADNEFGKSPADNEFGK